MHRRHFACPFDFFLRGVRLCDTKVLLDTLVKEIGRLRHHSYVVEQIVRIDFIDVCAVVIYFALVLFPESQQQFEESGLTASAFADDADNFALFGVHAHVFEYGRVLFIRKGQVFDVQVFVIESLSVLYRCDRRLFFQKVQNPVAAGKGLRQIPGQRRHREHWAETSENRHNADEHFAEVKHICRHQYNADNERDRNEQRYAKFGCRACLCDAVFHFLRLFQKYIRTTVDLALPVIFGIVQNNVFNTLDTVEEVSVERGELLTVVHARCFESARRDKRHNDTDNDKSCERD